MRSEREWKEFHKKVEEVEHYADDAFWAEVVSKFPDIKTGDFPPHASLMRRKQNREDIELWVMSNEKER